MNNPNKKNKKTRRLYFENPYKLEFKAEVMERVTWEQKPALILDQTCFYPESGGQPSDEGWINGTKVIKVLEEEGRILHLLDEDISGDKVVGKIDPLVRFDYMQQHSGQHILSQSFYEHLKAETLAFHLGRDTSTVEIDLRKISEKEVEEVERRASEIVFEDRAIKSYFVPEDKIESIFLRKPPKKKGIIRVVEVADFDYSACGGTHVRRTGEIGLIKILKWERIRNNIRFEFVCGKRALEDYIWKNRSLCELSNRFTVHEREILASVEKLFSDLKSQKRANKKMKEKISQYEAQDIIQETKGRIIKKIFTGKTQEEVRFLALNIIKKGAFIILFGVKGEERGHLVFACSESFNIDMRECIPLVSSLIEGRGGGSPTLVEVVGKGGEDLELALNKAYDHIREKVD